MSLSPESPVSTASTAPPKPPPASRARGPIVAPPAKVRADVRILPEQCKGCEFCIVFCPTQVLAVSQAYNAKGYHYPVVVADTCVDCKLCLSICPEYAIWPVPRNGSPVHTVANETRKETAA